MMRAILDPAGHEVVEVTADIQSSTRDMVAAAGAKGMINKPLAAEAVLQTVMQVLTD